MAENSKIGWTNHTANFWTGCMKVSPGCAHCYAETWANRYGRKVWGPAKTTRRQPVKSVYDNLHKWNRASDLDNPSKVFVGSLMDWAEDHPDADALRPQMWDTIRSADRLIFQMLTKRSDRIAALLPTFWDEIKARIWLGVSIENNDYTYRAGDLRHLDCAVRFVSYEPALGPLDQLNLNGLDWIIYGGESGPNYRPENKQWARDIKARCEIAGVAFFHKQSAAFRNEQGIELDGQIVQNYPTPRLALLMVDGEEQCFFD